MALGEVADAPLHSVAQSWMGLWKQWAKVCLKCVWIRSVKIPPLSWASFNYTHLYTHTLLCNMHDPHWHRQKLASTVRNSMFTGIQFWVSIMKKNLINMRRNQEVIWGFGQSVRHFGPDWNILTHIGLIVILYKHSWSPEDESHWLDPLSFPVAPQWAWHLWFWAHFSTIGWITITEHGGAEKCGRCGLSLLLVKIIWGKKDCH